MSTKVSLTINGIEYAADSAADPTITAETTLAQFIREKTPFRATKVTCAQGGCGACTVALTHADAALARTVTRPINSCLAKLFSLNGAVITTNDGIGSAKQGYHPIQTKMAQLSATQCGYCTNGFVMTLWSHLQDHPAATAEELERILDGNICRCTGYRPILDAFKSFAAPGVEADVSECRKANCCQRRATHPEEGSLDIEEMAKLIRGDDPAAATAANALAASGAKRAKQFHILRRAGAVQPGIPGGRVAATAVTWVDVNTLSELAYYMNHYAGLRVMLAVGCTTLGIYKSSYDAYVNISAIPELNQWTQNATGVTIGAAVVIQDVIDQLPSVKGPQEFSVKHFPGVVAHLGRVAGYAIRCRGSIGGNLVLCHQHRAPGDFFPSDVAVVLLGIDATVALLNVATNTTTSHSMTEFFGLSSLSGLVMVSVTIPFALSANEHFCSYKIALRQVMAHAYVNAAMKAVVDPATGGVVGPNPVVAIGGVAALPTRISALEQQLAGVTITNTVQIASLAGNLQKALAAIVQPGPPAVGRSAYRVQVATNFFYKFVLALQPTPSAALSKASLEWMQRTVTTASQTFQGPTQALEPVSVAQPKNDALTQCAGEAVYTADIATPRDAVFVALVQATQACATIEAVDLSYVTSVPGFIKFYDAKSLPAANNVFNVGPLFVSGTTEFAGQCIGAVAAASQEIADRCAQIIGWGVSYSPPTSTPIITIADALAANPPSLFPAASLPAPITRGDTSEATFAKCAKVVSGSRSIGSQFHFHMENHAVLATPAEGQIVVDLASQSVSQAQIAIATCLGVPMSDVTVRTRRCGGGFGAKVTAANFGGCVASWIARDLNLPARLNMHFEDPQRGLGARPLYRMDYKAGVDADSKLMAMDITVYMAVGRNASDTAFEMEKAISNIDNCYQCPNFSAKVIACKTNVPPATSVRGPGWIQSILFSEMIMNELARATGMDPAAFRALNFYKAGDTAPDGMPIQQPNISAMWTQLQASADVAKRVADVAEFNKSNKFVKRGLSLSAARFSVDWNPLNFNATVSVFADGSIAISHGGIEIGQGINVKVMAAAAYKFGLSKSDMLQFIKVLPATTRVAPNPTNVTGGSVASELACRAVMNACDTLNARLAPFRKGNQSWQAAAAAAANACVNLLAEGFTGNAAFAPYSKYNSWGVACTEVEVDGLTGQFEVLRSDLIFDCGVSMNPDVDVGQVEGGFMMGLGWFTSEVVDWDAATGEAITAGTWEQKPPMAADVPETLNVTLLENSSNPAGILSSKAVGEPPVSMATSVVQAIEAAVNAVRADCGQTPWQLTSVPLTVDQIAAACGITTSNYVLR